GRALASRHPGDLGHLGRVALGGRAVEDLPERFGGHDDPALRHGAAAGGVRRRHVDQARPPLVVEMGEAVGRGRGAHRVPTGARVGIRVAPRERTRLPTTSWGFTFPRASSRARSTAAKEAGTRDGSTPDRSERSRRASTASTLNVDVPAPEATAPRSLSHSSRNWKRSSSVRAPVGGWSNARACAGGRSSRAARRMAEGVRRRWSSPPATRSPVSYRAVWNADARP